jgi:hypothetical protein
MIWTRYCRSVAMGKTWVLDTQTKGTGAEMVPLEKVLKGRAPEPELALVPLNRAAPPKGVPAPETRQPRSFKVVDVMTRQTLAEGVGTQATVELLEKTRSVVDVRISVWQPRAEKWRLLTLGEQRALWEFRGRPDATAA